MSYITRIYYSITIIQATDFIKRKSLSYVVLRKITSRDEAAEAYVISSDTACNYYRDSNILLHKASGNNSCSYVFKPSESQSGQIF